MIHLSQTFALQWERDKICKAPSEKQGCIVVDDGESHSAGLNPVNLRAKTSGLAPLTGHRCQVWKFFDMFFVVSSSRDLKDRSKKRAVDKDL